MKNSVLEVYLKHFGKTYKDLRDEGLIPAIDLFEVYPGALSKYVELAPGCYLRFWAETQVLEELMFSIDTSDPDAPAYEGELPEPYSACTTRALTLQAFGAPEKSKSPYRMPSPIGDVGGWDTFSLESRGYSQVVLITKYDVGLSVTDFAFVSRVTGYDSFGTEPEGQEHAD